MKKFPGFTKIALVGLLSIGSAVALSACDQPQETGVIDQQPGTEAPIAGEAPVETTSPTATAGNENIVELTSTNDSFSTLNQAIEAAGLTETLSGEGPYTVFAPTDAAFAALPAGTVEELLKPENREQLVQLLSYHVIPGEVTSNQITAGEVNTVEGTPVTVEVDQASNEVRINDATVTQPDIDASNGVIHAVDQVILPPETAGS
ncbi:MAG: fasciclin domain-containing protein [Kastovskya adunca ATA6-11-RM4]|jgi:uncharacterized surface protein with fasciclin (FAS1) repeats|nr:fasciclin domain-containing protein [Kastovskya adunca ATA6-11-RM4]